MNTIFEILKDLFIGIILVVFTYEFNRNLEKILSIRDSIIFLFRSLSKIPRAIFSEESRLRVKEYGNQHPKEKETVGKWFDFYFWKIQNPVMVYFLPPAMMCLVWTEPKLQSINTPFTYIIICILGISLGLLFDWARPKIK